MNIDLNTLTLRELGVLINDAEKRLKALNNRQPLEKVRRQLMVVAETTGYTISELFGAQAVDAVTRGKVRRRKGPKIKPKYQDPESPWNTWTGRGKMPLWLASKIRFGQNPVDFLIPGVAKLSPNSKPLTGKRELFKKS